LYILNKAHETGGVGDRRLDKTPEDGG